jgi:PBP1b-binding outer membrane lipoprotein LpoB
MKTVLKIPAIIVMLVLTFTGCYEIQPHNNLSDCREQMKGSKKPKAVCDFCDCIHRDGKPLDSCLDAYEKAKEDSVQIP